MIEKLGVYAPAIAPLMLALALTLPLPERHGTSALVSGVGVLACLVLALVQFRRIQKQLKTSGDR